MILSTTVITSRGLTTTSTPSTTTTTIKSSTTIRLSSTPERGILRYETSNMLNTMILM
ncbi:hypothetical protein ACJIZ3_008739 [Penstemon smallii]|uniref:Uncharacterized protein n=1 Tax=Penstemon smallii TaxID=265156 RepID=A0ABD3TCQ8_9LAMI